MGDIFVGSTVDGERIALSDELRCGHVQIVGATGRGKTESVIVPWMLQDVFRGVGGILIDGKGDRTILARVDKAYKQAGLGKMSLAWLDLGDLKGSFVTNPLLYGSPQQVVDRLFSTFTFEKEYFKNVSYEAALLAVKALREGGETVTFRSIFELLSSDENLAILLQKLPEEPAKFLGRSIERYLSVPKRERNERFSGFMAQLSPFAEGELSPLVNGKGDEPNFFSLTEVVAPWLGKSDRKTVLISIPALLYQEAAVVLGKMFLQEIAWAVGIREGSDHRAFTPVFLDEFSAFVYAGFNGLLNKARSTKVALHLSHQSMADLEAVSVEFAKAVHTNTNVKCILGINDPTSADFYAKHFGTKETEKRTERAEKTGRWMEATKTGQMSVREVEEYKIHPNRLRNYSRGEGALGLIVDGYALTEEMKFARSLL